MPTVRSSPPRCVSAARERESLHTAGMQMRGAVLSALFWVMILHVSPLGSNKFNLFKRPVVTPQEGAVRLAGSSQARAEGRVEIYHRGEWGTVCDDGWNLSAAQVVCRQLRFPGAKSVAPGGTYGQGSGKIWLDETNCKGTEKYLSTCSFKEWGLTDCSHKEDAGVICQPHVPVSADDASNSLDHSVELSDELGQLFDSSEGCDFYINAHTDAAAAAAASGSMVNDEQSSQETVNTTVCAHRMILWLVPSLKTILSEAQEISFHLTETCQPHLAAFIRYMYTRRLDVTTATAKCFHQMASHFGMTRLMEDTGRLFTSLLPEDTTFFTQLSFYQYALDTGDDVLRNNCLQYMAWNYQNLSSSVAWSQVSAELLTDLLALSDLVVPDEASVLQSLEDWFFQRQAAQLVSNKTADEEALAAFLGLVRFPMMSAVALFDLQFTSSLYSAHRDLYQGRMLKGFQGNALPFAMLKNSSLFQDEDEDYRPRIYTGQPWSVVYNSNHSAPTYHYHNRGYPGQYGFTKSFSTPVHNSVLLKDNKVQWEVQFFTEQGQCSYRGFRCDSLPAAKLISSSYVQPHIGVRFSNRLLMSCQGRFICHVTDFKNNYAHMPSSSGQNLTYPCPEDQYVYHFVVRPEYT